MVSPNQPRSTPNPLMAWSLVALVGVLLALGCSISDGHEPTTPASAPRSVLEQARDVLGKGAQLAAAKLCEPGPVEATSEIGSWTVSRCAGVGSVTTTARWSVALFVQNDVVELVALSRDIDDGTTLDSAAIEARSQLKSWCAEPQTRLDDSTLWRFCASPVSSGAVARLALARPGGRVFVALAINDVVMEAFYASIGLSLR